MPKLAHLASLLPSALIPLVVGTSSAQGDQGGAGLLTQARISFVV